MRQTVDALHQIATQLPEPRALWWAAGGLIDALTSAPEPEWLAPAKVLCSKIDFQIRDLASGSQKSNERAAARDCCTPIARRKPATPRIKEIKQLYQLDSLFPRAGAAGACSKSTSSGWSPRCRHALAARRAEATLGAVRRRRADRARVFRERVADFKTKTNDLGNQQLIKLLDAIALVARKLPDPYPRQGQFMVIEMASAFLLVEHVVDHFSSPADDLEVQIVIMGGWLLDAAKGKSTGEPPTGLRADLTERIGVLQLRAQVAKEILANLQHVEQVLDAFARDAGKRDTLAELQPYLRQMHGALSVLGFTGAAQVISICEAHGRGVRRPDYARGRGRRGLDRRRPVQRRILPRALPPRPRAHEEAIALFFSRYEKRSVPPRIP